MITDPLINSMRIEGRQQPSASAGDCWVLMGRLHHAFAKTTRSEPVEYKDIAYISEGRLIRDNACEPDLTLDARIRVQRDNDQRVCDRPFDDIPSDPGRPVGFAEKAVHDIQIDIGMVVRDADGFISHIAPHCD